MLAGVLSTLAIAIVPAPSAPALPDNANNANGTNFCTQMAAIGYPAQCSTLVTLAQGVCTEYDRGRSLSAVTQLVDARTKDQGLSNYIIAGAPMYFCPQHQNMNP